MPTTQQNNSPLWTSVLGGASSGLNLLQGGFNFLKDIFGTDYSRSVDLQKDLMAAQFGYNRQLAEDQHNYNVEMAGLQNNYQKALMEMSQGYNLTNMQRQYLYNMFLSNKGRDIYAMRNSGINPATGTGTPGGSVSLPSAPQGSAGVLPAGLSSVAGGASVPNSHYSPLDASVGNNLRSVSEANLSDQKAVEQRIKNIYAAQRQIMELEKMKMEVKRGLTETEMKDNEIQMMLSTWEEQIGIARGTLKKLLAEADATPVIAEATKTQAAAAQQNADTNQFNSETNRLQYQEFVRNNKINNYLRNKEIGLQERVVDYNEKNAEEVYKQIQEHTLNMRLDNRRKATENLYIAELIASQIRLNEAEEKHYQQLARKSEKEADYYEMDKLLTHAENLLSNYNGFINASANAKNAVSNARRVDVMDKLSDAQVEFITERAAHMAAGRRTGTHTYTKHGVTPQGRPTTETWSAPWIPQ